MSVVERFIRFCESDFGASVMDRGAAYLSEFFEPNHRVLDVGAGIGSIEERPYGDILAKIKKHTGFGYVRKSGNSLRPTEKGEALVRYLMDRFPRVVDYEYTARMEADLDRIEGGDLHYREFLQEEFDWLEDPYTVAKENGWLDADRPTPAQIEFLGSLAEEVDADVPDDVLASKAAVSTWIDELREEVDPFVSLTDIHEAEAGGVAVHRFRLYFNEPLPDEEYDYFRDLKMKYKPGNREQLPGFQFQRQDREVVEEKWERLRERYSTGEALEGFEFEIGGGI